LLCTIDGLQISLFNIVERVLAVQVALLGVSNINVQDGEGSSALHVATEGKITEFWMAFLSFLS
jgi:hypothetical protein